MRKAISCSTLIYLLTTTAAVHAQAVPAADAANGSGGAALEEIVVTAQKRSENLQHVPISVTAINAANLQKTGIETTQALAFAVPSLVYTRTGAYAQPYLRGIGSELTLPNADPSVTTYVDGVVVSTSAGIIQDLLGVQRVEVLEGPQGTIYGRNATAGAINIYTLTPTEDLDAQLHASYGNYKAKKLTGYVSGGLSDTLAIGLYGGYSDRDSYLHQIGVGPHPGHERGVGARLKAVWTPIEDLKLTGSVEYTDSRSFEAGAFRNIQANNLAATLGTTNAAQPRYYINSGPANGAGLGEVNGRSYAGTLREEYDFGWARFLGITGYRKFRSVQGNDLDASPLPILEATSLPVRSKQFSQEAQLLSPEGSDISWIAGLYYLRENAGLFPVGILSSVIFPAPITGSWLNSGARLNSYAGFAQVTVPLDRFVSGVKLTVAGRYTHDQKRWKASGYFTTGPGTGTLIPGTETTYPVENTHSNNFSPKVTLDYQASQNLLLYATFARGYKAGAFNLSSAAIPMPPAVLPEKLDDIEGGFKAEMLDHRVRLNMAAYHYKLSNIQTSVIAGGSNGVTSLQNAASAKMYGVEGTLMVAVTHDFNLQATGAYEHTRYTSFPNAAGFTFSPFGNGSVVVDATGNNTPRAPKWVGSASANFDHVFDNKSGINASANVLYNGGFYWEPTNIISQKAYAVLNVNAGYTLPGGHISISAFATNLTNSYYASSTTIFPVAIGVMDAPPRMYGVSLDWKM